MGRAAEDVDATLAAVTILARSRALDPRNAAKGHWLQVPIWKLALQVAEEAGELAQAVLRQDDRAVDHEAGDLVWSTAMLVAAVRHWSGSTKARKAR
jgi:NTP pyrophosphatase (non-canonical NTP hydrolase)